MSARAVMRACAAAGQWRAGLSILEQLHRAGDGAGATPGGSAGGSAGGEGDELAPLPAMGGWEEEAAALSPRARTAQLSQACSLLDGM